MTPQRDCDLRVNEDKASSYRRRAREIERLTPQDLHGTIAPQSSPTIFGRAFRKGGGHD
jgi:hypothetical protein